MHRLSLRVLIPLSVFVVYLAIIGLSLLLNIARNAEELKEQSLGYLQQNVAALGRLAGRTVVNDPQTLEDSITQLSTNRLVKDIVVIEPDGKILFASRFAWRDAHAVEVLPDISLELLSRVKRSRKADIKYIEDKKIFVAMVSYSYPGKNTSLRNFDKGIIYISYDISDALMESRRAAVFQVLPEIAMSLLLLVLLMEILRRYVIAPLNTIKSAASDIALGKFDITIKQTGPVEIMDLVNTFNNMKNDLAGNIKELDRRAQQIQGILNNTFDGIIAIDEKGTVLSFNIRAEQIFMLDADNIIGKNVKTLMPSPYQEHHDQYLSNYMGSGKAKIIGIGREVEGLRADGSTFPLELAVTEILSDDLRMFIGIVRDITERKQKEKEVAAIQENLAEANAQLEELIRTDGLTGIANRRYFDEAIVLEFNRALRKKHHVSLLLFDVDYFKKYNDHYGHVEGDQCLVRIASAIKSLFQRSGELPARYGGEEFAVILPETSPDDALKSANMILERITDLRIEHVKSEVAEHVSVSIGVTSVIPTMKQSVKDLIQAADTALYNAKESGRNQTAFAHID